MKKNRNEGDKVFAVLATLVGALLAMCVLLAAKTYNPSTYELMMRAGTIEHPLPAFELEAMSGDMITDRHFKGRTSLLFFGDPSCSACGISYPALRKAQDVLPILYIGQRPKTLAGLGEQERFIFPIVYDSMNVLRTRLAIDGIPGAVLVNRDGVVVRKASGSTVVPALIEYAKNNIEESP